MLVTGLFALTLLVHAFLLVGVCKAIGRRADTAGAEPGGYLALGLAGWGAGVVVSAPATVLILYSWSKLPDLPDRWVGLIALVASMFGTGVGSGFAYLYVAMRTARHADYESMDDRTQSRFGLHITNIRQPGDGHDLRPE